MPLFFQITARAARSGGGWSLSIGTSWPRCGQRGSDRGAAWEASGLACPSPEQDCPSQLAAALLSEGNLHSALCVPHDQKFILMENKNQMQRALGVGYEILLRRKKMKKSDVFI